MELELAAEFVARKFHQGVDRETIALELELLYGFSCKSEALNFISAILW
jgi:hypothetical protein